MKHETTSMRTWNRTPSMIASAILFVGACAATAPVQAGSFALGADRTSNFVITSAANWQTILTINIPSSPHGHACQAVASWDALNPNGNAASQAYIFTITLDNPNPITNSTGVERRLEMRDQPSVNDPNTWPVSTNSVFGLTPNVPHVIRLLGRKAAGPNLTVDDAHLSILCI